MNIHLVSAGGRKKKKPEASWVESQSAGIGQVTLLTHLCAKRAEEEVLLAGQVEFLLLHGSSGRAWRLLWVMQRDNAKTGRDTEREREHSLWYTGSTACILPPPASNLGGGGVWWRQFFLTFLMWLDWSSVISASHTGTTHSHTGMWGHAVDCNAVTSTETILPPPHTHLHTYTCWKSGFAKPASSKSVFLPNLQTTSIYIVKVSSLTAM